METISGIGGYCIENLLSRCSHPAATPRARDAQARERPFAPNILTMITSAGALGRESASRRKQSPPCKLVHGLTCRRGHYPAIIDIPGSAALAAAPDIQASDFKLATTFSRGEPQMASSEIG
jgi:hypothetical protein